MIFDKNLLFAKIESEVIKNIYILCIEYLPLFGRI